VRPLPDRGAAAATTESGIILTAAGPNMQRVMREISLPSFYHYACRWNWAVHCEELAVDGVGADDSARRAKWAKVDLLRAALVRYQFALWLDADVLIVRTDDDIREHLHPESFQALALEQVPFEHRINPNTGVWLMRSGPAAFAFLDAVERLGQQPGPWADQGAVLGALGWHRGDTQYRWARPGVGNDFVAHTSWLPPAWNQPAVAARREEEVYTSTARSYEDRPTVSEPYALHFMGMTPAARYRHMSVAARGHTCLARRVDPGKPPTDTLAALDRAAWSRTTP
jgi:hypothetical protein